MILVGVQCAAGGVRGRARRRAAQPDALERAGRPYVEDAAAADPATVPVFALVVRVVAARLFEAVTYGTLTSLFEDRGLTLGHVVVHGATFATLMAVVQLT
jgi:hypothetical protein